ncbi:MAG TPA: adenylate/guanylate cyclase domain-containing protein [Geminicoccaceae bacterium]|nr:adenylate/guanylate cyclase domain-containing protein [Geminicoccaceae bacterium]
MERRLAAILAADVVGYSRLMAADEPGTLAALKAHRKEYVEPKITEHHGRIVKLMGDGVLVEFASVVDAVRCAVEVQQGIAQRNREVSEDRQVWFRIGVNLGDIIIEDGDIHGDGVNVAARLEALAEPGGICVSRTVRNHVQDKLLLAFKDLGERTLKNIPRPVRVFRVVTGEKPATAPKSGQRRPRPRVAAATMMMLAFAGGMAWWLLGRETETVSPSVTPMAPAEDPVLAMPSGPAIAVLPFDNLSGDPEQELFADGLTEDIITRLARFTDLHVIARNSTFRYKDQPVDLRQLRDELGARYVVEGSVRRSADALRVTAQLISADDGAHLWADTYNRDLGAAAVFDVQDDITDRVVAAVASNWGAIAWHELEEVRSKPPDSLASYDCVLLGHAYDRIVDAPSHQAALECLERTVEQEPNYAEAWAWLAHVYSEQVWNKFNMRAGEDPGELALGAAQRALKIDPENARAQAVLAFVYFWRRDRESYLKAAERALELNPNDTSILAEMALRMKGIALWERSFALVKKAIALSPNPLPWYYFPLIHYYYHEGEYQQSLAAVDKLGMPGNYWTYVLQAAIYGQLQERESAERAIATLLELNPDYPPNARQDVELWNWGAPDHVEHLLEGLRKAGLEIPQAAN